MPTASTASTARSSIITGAGQGIGRGMALHLGKHGARIVVAEWKAHRVERVVGELDRPRRRRARCRVQHPRARVDRRDGRGDRRRVRPGRRPHQQRAHVHRSRRRSADVDRRRRRPQPRHGQGHAVGDAGGVPAHASSKGWGRIVNFVSAAGITGMAGYGAYNASKEAIRALTRTAAREWGRDGIVVNAIAPGAASKRGQRGRARATRPSTASSSATIRWAAKVIPRTTSDRSRCSCAATPAGSSPARPSWSTAAHSCSRSQERHRACRSTTKRDDHIVVITIDRPEAKNSLDLYHFRDLAKAWRDFGDDDDLWLAIITGVDQCFMAGADLKTYIPQITELVEEDQRAARSPRSTAASCATAPTPCCATPSSTSRSSRRSTDRASPAAWRCSAASTSASRRRTRASA